MTEQRFRFKSVHHRTPQYAADWQERPYRKPRKRSPSQKATSGGIRLGVKPVKQPKFTALNVCPDCLHARDDLEQDLELDNGRLAKWVSIYLAADLSRGHHGTKLTAESVKDRAKDAEEEILTVIETLDADLRIIALALFFIRHLYGDTTGVKEGVDATVLTVGIILARRRLEGRLPDLFFNEATQEGKEWIWSQKDKLGDHFFVYGDRWKRWIRQLHSHCILLEARFQGIRLTEHPMPEALHKLQDLSVEPFVRTRELVKVLEYLQKKQSAPQWQPW
ncbi:hypothetical protein BKA70DRAFT_1420323 [Coprinopsis sp. MPI-PUGE-AT-0042]|nr:hypothetical protein BKA70DRAFT_1420323 [Coprinopsis sp. MPI-PUGE-AT-0042]